MSAPEPSPMSPEDAMQPPTPASGQPNLPPTSHVSPDFSNPPWIDVPGIYNFREVGGYPVAPSSTPHKSFRKGLIFRSAEPSKITDEGVQRLRELGVTTMFDLRSQNEIQRLRKLMPTVEIPGIERVFVPVFTEKHHSPEIVEQRYRDYASGNLERAYRSVLNAAGPSYSRILRHLISTPNSAILLHCTAGKDRTGVFVAVLLTLAGVPDDVIATEYELTQVGLGIVRGTMLHYLAAAKPFTKEGEKDKELGLEGAENMMSSRAESMRRTLDMLRHEFGGPEKYLREVCELSEEEVERLKALLVVEEEPSVDLERLKRALKAETAVKQ